MKLRYYMRGLGIGIIVTAILLSISLHAKNKPMTDEQVIARAKELGMEEKYDNAVLAEVVSGNDASDDPKAPDETVELETSESETSESETSDSDVSEAKKQDDNAKVTETTENKQANEALERAEQAKEDAKESASQTVKETEGLADDAAQLTVENPSKPERTQTDAQISDAGNKSGTEKNDTAGDNKEKDSPVKSGADKEKMKNPVEGKADETKSQGSADGKQNTTDSQSQVTITVSGGDGSFEVAKKLQAAGVIEDSKSFDDYLCQNGYDRRITTGKHLIRPNATQEEIAKELTTKVK